MSRKKKAGGSHDRDDYHDRGHHGHHGSSDKGVVLKGTKADNVLTGTDRNDKLYGLKGDDELSGLAGSDRLDGGKGNDLLDGGAGNDKVYGGRGNDLLLYSMAGNLGEGFADIGTHDVYDGGSGFDTLGLELTYGEFRLASVQEDIAAFRAFLECRANPRSDHGKTFQFKSFDLDAHDFEALTYRLVNNAPTAGTDNAAASEDTALVLAAPDLLANDTDSDHLDVLTLTGADASSARGAVVFVDADGDLNYDPTAALALQQLAEGASVVDSFSYTIADLGGLTATATVQITVTGVNDKPVALADSISANEDNAVSGNVLANDTDVDTGDSLHVATVNGSGANVGTQIELASGALLTVNADGSFEYDPNGQFEQLAVGESAEDSFTYVTADSLGAASNMATVTLTVEGVNDAPVALDDVVAPTDGGATQIETLLDFEGTIDLGNMNGYAIVNFFQFPGAGVGGSTVAAVSTGEGELGDPDGAVQRADGTDFAALSLAVAANSNAFWLTILGYDDGVQAASLPEPLLVNPRASGFTPVTFDASWSSIDQLRFFVDGTSDFILLDNVRLAQTSGGGASGYSEDEARPIDVLANDTDVDASDSLSVFEFDGISAMGARITLNGDGTLQYDPTEADDIQALAQGETATDTFEYTVSDGNGGTSVATVSVALLGADEPDPSLLGSLAAPDPDLL